MMSAIAGHAIAQTEISIGASNCAGCPVSVEVDAGELELIFLSGALSFWNSDSHSLCEDTGCWCTWVYVSVPATGQLIRFGAPDFYFTYEDAEAAAVGSTATILAPDQPTTVLLFVEDRSCSYCDDNRGGPIRISISEARPIQWPEASGGNGHYYEAIPGPLAWGAAFDLASQRTWAGYQGHLATITSAAENDWLCTNLGLDRDWLGGIQIEGSTEPDGGWIWITGEPWEYENWDEGEPNNDHEGTETRLMGWDSCSWNDARPEDPDIQRTIIEYGTEIQFGFLRVDVRTVTGLPHPGATVQVLDASGAWIDEKPTIDGIVVFSGLSAGLYRVWAEDGYNDSGIWREVFVNAGPIADVTLRVAAGTTLSGRVVDAWNWWPVRGAEVELFYDGSSTGLTDLTDELGHYCFELPGTGTYTVSAIKTLQNDGSDQNAYQPWGSDEVVVTELKSGNVAPDLPLETRTVVMLHGVNSNCGIWSNDQGDFSALLAANGWLAMDDINLAGRGLTEDSWGMARIPEQADQLEDTLWERLNDQGVRSFWIIAHSQGGLVARWILDRESVEGVDRNPVTLSMVPGLITIGTPHHGSPLSRSRLIYETLLCEPGCLTDPPYGLLDLYCQRTCMGIWEDMKDEEFFGMVYRSYPAVQNLLPNSEFMRLLNRRDKLQNDWALGLCENDIPGEVALLELGGGIRPSYASIAYTIDPLSLAGAAPVAWAELCRISGCRDSDAVVPTKSSYLHAEYEGSQRAFNYIDDGPWHRELPRYSALQDFTVQQLLGVDSADWPTTTPYPLGSKSMEPGEEWHQIIADWMFVPAAEARVDTFMLGVCDSLQVEWAPTVGTMSFTLRDPSGTVIDSLIAATDSNLLFESTPDGGGSLTLAGTVPGPWALTLINTTVEDDDRYIYTVKVVDGVDFDLRWAATGEYDREVYAELVDDDSLPLAATVAGSISGPNGGTTEVAFADDGVAPDAQAGDGVHTATVTLDAEYGASVLRVYADGDTLNPFHRQEFLAFERRASLDVGISAGGLVIDAGTASAAAPVTLSATIENRSREDTTVETRFLLTATLETFAVDTLLVPSGSDMTAVATHTPLWEGEFEYAVDLRLLDDALDVDYSDNLASDSVVISHALCGVDDGDDGDGTDILTGRSGPAIGIVGAYPNPFNAAITVRFETTRDGDVMVDVFDLRGRRLATLSEGYLSAGHHWAVWRGTDDRGRKAASGIYFVRARSNGEQDMKKVVLVR